MIGSCVGCDLRFCLCFGGWFLLVFDVLTFSDLSLLVWHFGFRCVGDLRFSLWFDELWFGF